MVGTSQVTSLLIGVDVVDVKLPLSQFQNTTFVKEDVLKLVQSINRAGPSPLKDDILNRTFSALWPDFEKSVQHFIDTLSISPAAADNQEQQSDVDLIKTSVGELIQSVNALKEDMRRTSRISDDRNIIREVRAVAARAKNLPAGLDQDVKSALSVLQEYQDILGDAASIPDDVVNDLITNLKRASNYIHMHTVQRNSYPEADTSASSIAGATTNSDPD